MPSFGAHPDEEGIIGVRSAAGGMGVGRGVLFLRRNKLLFVRCCICVFWLFEMSVYTSVIENDLEGLLQLYNIGELVDFRGIAQGIRNTNYFVNTTSRRYVLVLFEHHQAEAIVYHVRLMAYLSAQGISSPSPVADKKGSFLNTLCQRPCLLVKCLPGDTVYMPNATQCSRLGSVLAEFHLISSFHKYPPPSDAYGLSWMFGSGNLLKNMVEERCIEVLLDELAYQNGVDASVLPKGTIHTDLFRDNVLFEGNKLSGLLDFYDACLGAYIYDLAVVVNDWCRDDAGGLDEERYFPLVQAYARQRPLNACEKRLWGSMLRRAALRYWVSRLRDFFLPKIGAITHTKSPDVYMRILLASRSHPPVLLT